MNTLLLNQQQANTIRVLFNTVALYAMEIEYKLKLHENYAIFHLHADCYNIFYHINSNGYITRVYKLVDDEPYEMDNYIQLDKDVIQQSDVKKINHLFAVTNLN